MNVLILKAAITTVFITCTCHWLCVHKGSIYDNILPSTNTGNVYKKGTGPH